MGDTIDKKASRMDVKTFNASQNIKYALRALHPADCTSRAIKVFHREDKHYTPIDSSLVNNMRHARSRQKAEQHSAREELQKEKDTFQINDEQKKTKKAVAESSVKAAKEGKAQHQSILEQAYKPIVMNDNNEFSE